MVLGNGLANQVSNPHVEVDITKPDMVIRKQIAVLKEMTVWLKAAHSGNDITYDTGKNRPLVQKFTMMTSLPCILHHSLGSASQANSSCSCSSILVFSLLLTAIDVFEIGVLQQGNTCSTPFGNHHWVKSF